MRSEQAHCTTVDTTAAGARVEARETSATHNAIAVSTIVTRFWRFSGSAPHHTQSCERAVGWAAVVTAAAAAVVTTTVGMADDEYGEDEDDFEDYEDEFEPDEQAEADIQQALQQEAAAVAERLKQANKGPVKTQFLASKPAIEQPLAAPSKHLIAPPTQSSRALRAQKTARLEELRKVIKLRSVDVLLYDAAPLTAYELHTRHQSRHLRAKSVQTGDDDVEVAVQTEPPEAQELECQVPEDLGTAGRNTASISKSEGAQTASLLSANTARLNRFLRSAGQLMESLCSENVRGTASGFSASHAHSQLSVRAATMRLPEQLGPRALVDVSFAAEGDSLLAAYGVDAEAAQEPRPKGRKEAARRLLGEGLLCVWRLQQTEAPWQLLRCIGLPSCCLSLRRSHLALCGTHEGGVQLWDLREPASQHVSAEVDGAQAALRSPSFCSDAATGNHTSPVVAVTELPSSAGNAPRPPPPASQSPAGAAGRDRERRRARGGEKPRVRGLYISC